VGSSIFRNFADDTKLTGVFSMPEGQDVIQRDPEKLKKWDPVNLIRFKKTKFKVLHMGRGNPQHKYRLRV